MCSGIQGMIQDGKMDGIRVGRIEGEAKAKKEMARSLAGMGMSAEKIAEAAKVSISIVREWLSENAGCP